LAYIDQRANDALTGIMNANETPKELPIELKAHIATLLNLYRKSIREAEEFELLPDVLHKAILIDFAKQIKASPALKYNINALAKKHRIYYKTLAKSFKELTGFTLKLYVYEQRMHHALSMVTSSKLPFNEIASELGYIEPNNLHRAFVKRFGKTLLEVRNNPGVLSYSHR
jgi:AraC-like DNA-binding protein